MCPPGVDLGREETHKYSRRYLQLIYSIYKSMLQNGAKTTAPSERLMPIATSTSLVPYTRGTPHIVTGRLRYKRSTHLTFSMLIFLAQQMKPTYGRPRLLCEAKPMPNMHT